MDTEVKSPCVNVCQLGDNNVCLGCWRSLEEIGDWSYASSDERQRIIETAQQRQLSMKND
jgi:predicted Fe-S protein YdhL (DUF1289 family)